MFSIAPLVVVVVVVVVISGCVGRSALTMRGSDRTLSVRVTTHYHGLDKQKLTHPQHTIDREFFFAGSLVLISSL